MTETQTVTVKTIGFIVNPIAGMGGATGLKGTDGKVVLDRAVLLGAKPIAPARAETFLLELAPFKHYIYLLVGAGDMGETCAKKLGYSYTVIGKRRQQTSSKDTKNIAKSIVEAKVDLLVFCGGDGTARDILKSVDVKLPVLGVPTGVKMHSAVFAVNPKAAARVVYRFLQGELPVREAEIMDVNEQAFREGHLSAVLYGYILSPYEPQLIQVSKLASPTTENEVCNQAAIAVYVIENMQPDILYIMGPGTTTRTIGDLLDQQKTLLGVDLFVNKQIITKDANEEQILQALKGKRARIIVTLIGGQGFIFGRGNQQISAKVIWQVGLENIVIVATESKMQGLKSLKVDTGDPLLDTKVKAQRFQVLIDYSRWKEICVE
ncbi:MAG: ATP-NAD kinase family protein [Candidatus Bathyarchaeota archaeon]|uniref:ATP-NAD kinase family protein n=1 Tax=Candidatus Bathycorpusculum sp. TaxID=2994959 RepID=UPI002836747C|nr:ATP-NAD kinase family protein [Candidatus Termiticorpusculum sp.]MCL2256851.1 ATP-NAD kinase family protein [Candidatus Termiticorpusculum sp.]MCL2293006.1 ATP-NAD kinase family protein [Candidatus Termiticorpusculum sp.]